MDEPIENSQTDTIEVEQAKAPARGADFWLPRIIAVVAFLIVIVGAAVLNLVFSTQGGPLSTVEVQRVEAERLVKEKPKDFDAHVKLGDVYFRMQQYDKAIAEYKKASKIKAKSAVPHYAIATVYNAQGRANQAIKELNTALKLAPGYSEAYFLLGEIYFNQDKYGEAEKAFKKLTELEPVLADAHYRLGLTYEKQGRRELAIGEYQETLRFVPDHEDAQAALRRLEK